MSERFFISSPISGDHATLEGAEAHHLSRVMRVQVGDDVVLFDGSGSEFEARVVTISKARVELAVQSRRDFDRESPVRLTLAVALPKGERQRWVVEKAVELGVAAIVPLVVRRGVAEPSLSALDRLRRAVIEASKQCGRNRLLEIAPPRDWAELIQSVKHESIRLLAHPGGRPLAEVLSADMSRTVDDMVAAVGPEGGFAEDEVEAAISAGWTPIDLGPRTLRVETAALAIAAWAAQFPKA